jgi:hypothetical protein
VGLSEPEYEKALEARDELGLRPRAVASSREPDGVRFAAVWDRYRAR